MTNKSHQEIVLEYANQKLIKKQKEKGIWKSDLDRTYVVYLRRSSKGKMKKGDEVEEKQANSLGSQRKACQTYAITNKLKVYDYIEEKESAFVSGKRPKFDAILEEINKGKGRKYNSILAFTPDRLSRNMKEAGEIIDLLDSQELTDLKFAAFHLENDYNGLMNLGIHFVMAKQYSDNISAHTKKGNTKKQEQGKGLAVPRHGYKFESEKDRYFRPDGKSYELLRSAFIKKINGEPLERIKKYLHDSGYSYRGKKSKINNQRLSDIFSDPFYAGIYVTSTSLVVLKDVDPLFKPMITFEEFIALRASLDSHTGFTKPKSDTILYRGMVNCSYCSSRMTPVKGYNRYKTRYLSLQCSTKSCIRHSKEAKAEAKKEGRKLKIQVRSYVIKDFMETLLTEGITIDKKIYTEHLNMAKSNAKEELDQLNNKLFETRRQINEKNKEIDEKSNTLNYLKTESSRQRTSKQIDAISKELDKLETIEEDQQAAISQQQIKLNTELISYEKFKGYFKYVNDIIQNSENRFEVDHAIRSVFLNFELDSEKVVSYTLNPEVEPYLKVGSITNGVDEGT